MLIAHYRSQKQSQQMGCENCVDLTVKFMRNTVVEGKKWRLKFLYLT